MLRTAKRTLSVVLILFIALMCGTSCSKKSEDSKSGATKQKSIPAGPLMSQFIRFEYAIYYLPAPTNDPLHELGQLLAAEKGAPTLVNEPQKQSDKPIVHAYFIENVEINYAPPDLHSLQYFGRGLTPDQAEQLQKSRRAFVMDFAHGKTHVWGGLRTANSIAEALARRTGGLLWDDETREVFTPDEWHKRRVQSWTNGIPDVCKQTTIHAYKSDEYVRAITLGMGKVGLPDLVADRFPWSLSGNMGHLINMVGQSMAEGAVIQTPGQYDLDIRAIQNKEVREPQVISLKSNAAAVARLALREGTWEEGDPRNRLIEIAFDRYPGRDVHAKQEALISSLFGWEDAVTPVKNNEALLAARDRARQKLPALRNQFIAGLNPGEFISVKAPFKTRDGGQEWMWVEVTAWEGSHIKGILKNEPFDVPSLHSGQVVEVKQEDIFDYTRHFPDGREEGNETGAIIQSMQKTTE